MDRDCRTARRRRAAAVVALTGAALLLTGCVGVGLPAVSPDPSTPAASAPEEPAASESPPAEPTPSEAPAEPPAGEIDARSAVELALEAGDGVVVDVGRGTEGGVEVWEVGVLRPDGSGVERKLAVADGTLVREEPEDLDADQRTAPGIPAIAAIDAALAAVPGRVVELDLGSEAGRLVWEVLVDADAGGRFEVHLDAATGELVRSERDD